MNTTSRKNYRLLERKEAAEYLGMSTTVLDRLTRKGYIAYIETPSSGKVGRPTRKWTTEDLNDFIDQRRRRATPKQAQKPAHKRRNKRNAIDLQASSAVAILAASKGGAQ